MNHLQITENITELVGGTPMLHLRRMVPEGCADVFAKLEYLNPGGRVKDRAAIGMIRRAEQEGRLQPGATIVEATAGNTGIGLALIGVNKGYKVILCVPDGFAEEKVKIMRALGAEVFRTPEPEGMQGARIPPILTFIKRQQPRKSSTRCRAKLMPWLSAWERAELLPALHGS